MSSVFRSGGHLLRNRGASGATLRTSSSDATQTLVTHPVESLRGVLQDISWRSIRNAVLTSGILAGTGDVLAQALGASHQHADAPPAEYQSVRTARMLAFGALYGPVQLYWYRLQEHVIRGQSAAAVAMKGVSNQLVLGPVVVSGVLSWNLLCQGRAAGIPDKLRQDFLATWAMGICYWIPVGTVAFALVPVHHRVLYFSTASVFFNAGLSYVSANSVKELEETLEETVVPHHPHL